MTNGFARTVGKFCYRLAIALDQLNHDVKRLHRRNIAGQTRSNTKHHVGALTKMLIKRQRLVQVQIILEDQRFGERINVQLLVMRNRFFTPGHRIAGILT